MWRGFLSLGGLEVANSARAIGYAESADCPLAWFNDKPCLGFLELENIPGGYDHSQISDAPWYDPDNADMTSRFYGVHILSMENPSDSPVEATITQRVGKGARISTVREASKNIRVRALLSANGRDALEIGKLWLNRVLAADACGAHGSVCGVSDLEFFLDCPPSRIPGEPQEDFLARVDEYRLFMHDVARTSGPFKVESRRSSDGRHFGEVVEFTITTEDPSLYGVTREISIPPSSPTVVQDIAYNQFPYPSAELSSGTVVVATQHSLNPSLETDASGWAKYQDGAQITTGQVTGGRITGELAASGVASYRSVFTSTGSNVTGGSFGAEQEVALPAWVAGDRFSLNMWAAAIVMGGTQNFNGIVFEALWRAGGSTLRTDTLGTVDPAGGSVSLLAVAPPATATSVIIRARLRVNSWTTGTIVRFYADALGVTTP